MQTSFIIASVMAQPVMAGVTWFLGAEYRHQEDAPNRVVFVPKGGRYVPIETHRRPAAGTQFIRNIATREAEFDAYCWAQGSDGMSTTNMDAAEALLLNLVGALNLTFGDYEVVEDKTLSVTGSQLSDAGVVYVLTFKFRVPVTLPTSDTVAIQLVSTAAVPGTSALLPTIQAVIR